MITIFGRARRTAAATWWFVLMLSAGAGAADAPVTPPKAPDAERARTDDELREVQRAAEERLRAAMAAADPEVDRAALAAAERELKAAGEEAERVRLPTGPHSGPPTNPAQAAAARRFFRALNAYRRLEQDAREARDAIQRAAADVDAARLAISRAALRKRRDYLPVTAFQLKWDAGKLAGRFVRLEGCRFEAVAVGQSAPVRWLPEHLDEGVGADRPIPRLKGPPGVGRSPAPHAREYAAFSFKDDTGEYGAALARLTFEARDLSKYPPGAGLDLYGVIVQLEDSREPYVLVCEDVVRHWTSRPGRAPFPNPARPDVEPFDVEASAASAASIARLAYVDNRDRQEHVFTQQADGTWTERFGKTELRCEPVGESTRPNRRGLVLRRTSDNLELLIPEEGVGGMICWRPGGTDSYWRMMAKVASVERRDPKAASRPVEAPAAKPGR